MKRHKNILKRIIAGGGVALVMIVSLFAGVPSPLFNLQVVKAANTYSGNAGPEGSNSVMWTYDDSTKTLTFSGKGEMENTSYSLNKYIDVNGVDQKDKVIQATKIVIGDDITNIYIQQSSEFDNLEEVVISDSVKTIEYFGLSMAKKLTKVTGGVNVETIGESAFRECSSLENIYFPKVKTIGERAFQNCTSLKTVDMPNAEDAPYYSFYGCNNLKVVNLPNVKSIGYYAFAVCRNIEELNIENFEKELSCKLSYATNLKKLTISPSAPINDGLFANSASIETITIKAGAISSDTFKNLKSSINPNTGAMVIKGSYKDLSWLDSDGKEVHANSWDSAVSYFKDTLFKDTLGLDANWKIINKVDWDNVKFSPTNKTVSIINSDCGYKPADIQYSKDGINWSDLTLNKDGTVGSFTEELHKDDKFYLKQNYVDDNIKEYTITQATTDKSALICAILSSTPEDIIKNWIRFNYDNYEYCLGKEDAPASDAVWRNTVKGSVLVEIGDNTKIFYRNAGDSGQLAGDIVCKPLGISLFGVGVNVLEKKLTNTTENMQFNIQPNNTYNNNWVDCSEGETELKITGEIIKKLDITIRQKDNQDSKYSFTLTAPNFPDNEVTVEVKPTDYESASETRINLNFKESATSTLSDYEYYIGSDDPDASTEWTTFKSNSQVTGLKYNDKSLYVRMKATEDTLASGYNKYDIKRGVDSQLDELKNVTVDLTNPSKVQLSNTTTNMQYTVVGKGDVYDADTAKWTSCKADTTDIGNGLEAGDTIYLRQADKKSVTYKVGQVQEAPEAGDVSGGDGTITNLNTSKVLQYISKEDADAANNNSSWSWIWTDIPVASDDNITNELNVADVNTPGIYYVRFAKSGSGSDTQLESPYIEVEVTSEVVIEFNNNLGIKVPDNVSLKLTGIKKGEKIKEIELTADDNHYFSASEGDYKDELYVEGISVKRKDNRTIIISGSPNETYVNVQLRAATEKKTQTAVNLKNYGDNANDSNITGNIQDGIVISAAGKGTIIIPEGMEYGEQKLENGVSKTEFTKVNDGNEGTLKISKPGVYEVRKSMTDTQKAGESVILTVKGQLEVTSGEHMTFVKKSGVIEDSNIDVSQDNNKRYIYTYKELNDTIKFELKADDGYIFTSEYVSLDENDANNDGFTVKRSSDGKTITITVTPKDLTMTLALENAAEKDFVTEARNNIQSAYGDALEQLNNLTGWSDSDKESKDKDLLRKELESILNTAKDKVITASEKGTEQQEQKANVLDVVKNVKSDFETVLKKAQEVIKLRKSYDDTNSYIENVRADEADESSAELTVDQKKEYKKQAEIVMDDNNTLTDKLVKDIINAASSADAESKVSAAQEKFKLIKEKALADTKKKQAVNDIEARSSKVIEQLKALAGLTKQQKEVLINEINDKLPEAVTAIEKVEFKDLGSSAEVTTNLEKISTAKSGYMDYVNQKLTTANSDSKKFIDGAKKDVTAKAEDAEKDIQKLFDNGGITEEQKDDYLTRLNEVTNTTNSNIDKKTTTDDIDKEKQSGLNKLDKLVAEANLQVKKNEAENEFEQITKDAKNTIEQLEGLTKEDKDGYIERIDEILKQTKQAIEAATTEDKITDALEEGNQSIGSLITRSEAVAKGKREELRESTANNIQIKADEAKKDVDNLEYLTEQEKQYYKDELQKKADAAIAKLANEDTSNDTVQKIKDIGTNAQGELDKLVNEAKQQDIKAKAKKEFNEYAKAKKDAIDKLTNLSEEEKQDYKDEIDELVKAAESELENSDDEAAVNEVLNKVKSDVDAVTAKANEKSKLRQNAKEELNKYAENKKDAISKLTGLSEEEKQDYKDEIDELVKSAESELENSDDEAAVNKVLSKVKSDVDAVTAKANEKSELRQNAKEELNKYAENKKDAISKLTGLSEEEKKSYENEIDNLVKSAESELENCDDEAAVNEVLNKVKSEVDAVTAKANEKSELRQNAKEELNKYAENKKDAISKLTGLSEEEKQAYKDEIDKLVKAAESELENCDDEAAVNEVLSKVKSEVDAVTAKANEKSEKTEQERKQLEEAKQNAKEELNKYAENKKDAISKLTGLSEEEKKSYENEIDKLVKSAESELENSGDKDAVNEALSKGKSEVDAVTEKANEKSEKTEQERKQLEEAKQKAKEELNKYAENKKDAISKLAGLSEEEKKSYENEIDNLVKSAESELENSGDKDAVNEALSKGKSEVDAVTAKANEKSEKTEQERKQLEEAKQKAKEELNKYAENKKDAISKLTGLSEEEKKSYENEIDNLVKAAESELENSGDKDAVNEILSKVKSELDNVTAKANEKSDDNLNKDIEQRKQDAADDIQKRADEAKQEIDKLENLTEAEKDAYKEELQEKADSAKEKLTNKDSALDTVEKINDLKKNTQEELNNIVDKAKAQDTKNKEDKEQAEQEKKQLEEAKQKAKEELNEYAENKKDAIGKLTGLSEEEKKSYENEIDKLVKETEGTLDNCSDKDAVNEALSNGKSELDNVTVNANEKSDDNLNKNIEQRKQDAADDIQKYTDEAKDKIDKLENLTEAEKDAYKEELQEKADSAKEELTNKDSALDTQDKINDLKKKTEEEIDNIVNKAQKVNKERVIKNVTDVDNNVHNADIGNISEELYEKIFTAEEQEKIDNGEVARVYLLVSDGKDSISAEDKALMEQAVAAYGTSQFDMYLDISMFKQIGNGEPERISNTAGSVSITFKLDDELINTDKNIQRTYSIVRVHNGVVDILDSVFDEATRSLSFETDRFSSYAIIYTDKVINDNAKDDANKDNNEPNKDAALPSNKDDGAVNSDKDVPTGDTANTGVWALNTLLAGMAAILSMLTARRKRKM